MGRKARYAGENVPEAAPLHENAQFFKCFEQLAGLDWVGLEVGGDPRVDWTSSSLLPASPLLPVISCWKHLDTNPDKDTKTNPDKDTVVHI